MIKQLIKTEWMIQRTRLAAYLLLCAAVYGIFCFATDNIIIALASIGFLTVYFQLSLCFELEYKNSAPILLLAAPYTRDDIVKARFAATLLYLSLFYALTLAITLILSLWGSLRIAEWTTGLLCSAILCCIACSIMIPVFYRFGYVKGRNLQFIAFIAITLIGLAYLNLSPDRGASGAISGGMLVWGAVISGFCILLSYLLCLSIMRKKQF